jgi:hypothetical protein
MTRGVNAYPDISPGRRHRNGFYTPELFAVFDNGSFGVAINESTPSSNPGDTGLAIVDIA